MGLIDADAMMKHLENLLCGNCDTPRKEGWCDVCDYAYLMDEMKKEPIVDAIEVIKCKDCKYMTEHYDTDGNVSYWTCSEWDAGTDYDGYCHYGERREDVGK